MTEEIKSFNLNKIDQVLKELNNYYNTKANSNKENERIEKLTIELNNQINRILRKQKLEKTFFFFGLILLFIGLVVLFWSNLEIHFIYLMRLFVVNVNFI